MPMAEPLGASRLVPLLGRGSGRSMGRRPSLAMSISCISLFSDVIDTTRADAALSGWAWNTGYLAVGLVAWLARLLGVAAEVPLAVNAMPASSAKATRLTIIANLPFIIKAPPILLDNGIQLHG